MHADASLLLSLLDLDLTTSGWDGSEEPYPGISPTQFAYQHLRRSLTKKYLFGNTLKSNTAADADALTLFLSVNEKCKTWSLDSNLSSWEEIAINEAKAFIYDFFYPNETDFILSLGQIYSGLGVGPGSSIGAKETDLYSKLAISSLSYTDPDLPLLYRDAIRSNSTWCGMEQLRATRVEAEMVKGSRLSFVPKTAKISRTICTEPILNMMFQKGIAKVLEARLADKMGLYLSTQPDRNSELARIGSLTGKFGTIDLSSASDSISISLCKEILPAPVLSWLMRTRCPSTTLPSGEEIELHMISSMGNAFTFPLQTMIFTAVVVGCYRALDIPIRRNGKHTNGNFAVFGDDIVVVDKAYNLVCRLLEIFGFSVNHHKSFNSGTFRESCGSDYFQGHNVRGVYIRYLRDVNDCYSAINRLVRWAGKHRAGLHHLVGFLMQRVSYLPIPFDESDDAGVKVPAFMLTRVSLHPETRAVKYHYSKLKDRRVTFLPKRGEPNLPGWFENPDGLMIALLAGNIRNGFVSLRTTKRKAVIKKRFSSRWDWIPSDQRESVGSADLWKWSAWSHFCNVSQN